MRLKYRIGKTWMSLICAAVIAAPLVGCGTILYPERRGQSAMGRLDVDIVILDGLGLFFFLVPGVIAFAVDFATGAIYLPRGHKSKASELLGELELREERRLRELNAGSPEAVQMGLTSLRPGFRSAS